jgi:hypothetical protein
LYADRFYVKSRPVLYLTTPLQKYKDLLGCIDGEGKEQLLFAGLSRRWLLYLEFRFLENIVLFAGVSLKQAGAYSVLI